MRKTVGIVLAATLCAGCLALAACGGSSGSAPKPTSEPAAETSAAATEASAPAESSPAAAEPAAAESSPAAAAPAAATPSDPAEAFIGEWTFAAANYNGLMISGDMSMIEWAAGSSLVVDADGTGKVGMFGDEITFAWTLTADGKALDMTPISEDGEASSDIAIAQIVLIEPGTLGFTMEADGSSATMYFSADGTYPDAKTISAKDAKPITSPEQLIGTWSLAGMNYGGATVTGEPEALAEMAGYDDATLVINEDGTASAFGYDSNWKITDDGAVVNEGETGMPVMALGDDIIVDLSAYAGMDMQLLLIK